MKARIAASRCSSARCQVHSDAEETLREVIARVSDSQTLSQRMARETRFFSRLMLYYAVKAFLSAHIRYAQHFGLYPAQAVAERGQRMIQRELQTIARELT
jgi:hypothetical protein